MNDAFNKFGKPNDEIEDIASQLEKIAEHYLRDMVHRGYSAVDIRATGSYFAGCVHIAESMAIMDLGRKIRQDKIDSADPNLSEQERNLCLEFVEEQKKISTLNLFAGQTNPKHKSKIDAIQSYKDRTGLGLKESKDKIEAFIDKYLSGY